MFKLSPLVFLSSCVLSTIASAHDNPAEYTAHSQGEVEAHQHDTHVTSANVTSTKPYLFEMGFGYKNGSLDPLAAAREGLEGDVSGLTLSVDMLSTSGTQTSALLLGGSISMYDFDDSTGFSQQVIDSSNGRVTTRSSEASGLGISAYAGVRFFPHPQVRADMLVGYEKITSASRDIVGCSNCFESDFSLDGGAYVMPRLSLGKSISIDLFYKHWVTGDVDSMPGISLSLRSQ